MSTFYVNEAAFDLPDIGFIDQTVHVLEAVTESGTVGMFMHRAPLPADKSLREMAAGQLEHERRTLTGHGVLFESEAEVGGAPALRFGTRWRGEKHMVYQHLAFIALADTWLLLGVNAAMEHRDMADKVMEHVLASFRLRGG